MPKKQKINHSVIESKKGLQTQQNEQKKKLLIVHMAAKSTVTRAGKTYQVRSNPPRDKNGKVVPTSHEKKRRTKAKSVMARAWENYRLSVRRGENVPKTGTPAFKKYFGQLLKKETLPSGRQMAATHKRRLTQCRNNTGKLKSCKNL